MIYDHIIRYRREQVIPGTRIAFVGANDWLPALVIHAAEYGFRKQRWLPDWLFWLNFMYSKDRSDSRLSGITPT